MRLSELMKVATSNASSVREEPTQANWKYTVDAVLVLVVSWYKNKKREGDLAGFCAYRR